jgi:hypothetical protein
LQQQLGTLNNESQIVLSFQTEDLLLDSQLQDETEVNANIQRNQSHTSRAIMMAKKKLKRKKEAEEDAIWKKALAILDKASTSDDLKVCRICCFRTSRIAYWLSPKDGKEKYSTHPTGC